MGLIAKHDPVGIDAAISKQQRDLFLELTIKHNWRDYVSYHRAYRNRKDKDLLPEVYTENGEYKEVLFSDRETVSSFYLTDEKRTYDPKKFTWTQGASIISQANLSKLFCDIKHRADEEMIGNIRDAIGRKNWLPHLTDIITGVDKVYDSLKISNDKKYYDDMGSFSIVRFNFEMIYTNGIPTSIIQ